MSWVKANEEGKAELQVVSVTAGTYEITASAGNEPAFECAVCNVCGR